MTYKLVKSIVTVLDSVPKLDVASNPDNPLSIDLDSKSELVVRGVTNVKATVTICPVVSVPKLDVASNPDNLISVDFVTVPELVVSGVTDNERVIIGSAKSEIVVTYKPVNATGNVTISTPKLEVTYNPDKPTFTI